MSAKPQNPVTMPHMLRRQALARPGAVAFVAGEQSVSYAELDRRSDRIATALRGAGAAVQDRVAIVDQNSIRYFELFFGSAKAAMTLVGVNTRLAPPEIAWIVNDARARVLFVSRPHYAAAEKIEPELLHTTHIVALDGDHPRWPSWDDWIGRHANDKLPTTDGRLDHDVIQLYTSGTTGHPKGVCHTNDTWLRYADATAAAWADYGHDTVTLVCMPVFHVAGFNQTCLTIRAGGRVILLTKAEPAEIVGAMDRHGVTDTLFVPAIIRGVLDHAQREGIRPNTLRTISYGASAMPLDLLAAARGFFGCGFVHLYGLTEILGAGTYLPSAEHTAELLLSCGRAYPGLSVRIVDGDGRVLPAGEVGEIVMQCGWTMREYWRQPDATADTVRNGWLHSGDAGRLDEHGYLFLHDRVKDMIKTGGENVYPLEVELALLAHPSVADVAVIGVPDVHWGEAVKAVVVLKPGSVLDAAGLLADARARLAGYKLPKSIDVVEALPRNASGKVLRRVLRERYWSAHTRRIN